METFLHHTHTHAALSHATITQSQLYDAKVARLDMTESKTLHLTENKRLNEDLLRMWRWSYTHLWWRWRKSKLAYLSRLTIQGTVSTLRTHAPLRSVKSRLLSSACEQTAALTSVYRINASAIYTASNGSSVVIFLNDSFYTLTKQHTRIFQHPNSKQPGNNMYVHGSCRSTLGNMGLREYSAIKWLKQVWNNEVWHWRTRGKHIYCINTFYI